MTEREGERRPGESAPEIPREPPPRPETPGRRVGPEREIPGIPRPEPEIPRTPARPDAPFDPNAPGQ
jgi:hypothetical protein